MSSKGNARQEAILGAAFAVLRETKGRSFTLERIAQRAGVSKGGLTHHFSSKEKLIEALYTRMTQVFESQVTKLSGGRTLGSRKEMEAYITASLQQPMRGMAAELGTGVMCMLSDDPVKNDRLVEPLRRLYADYLGPFRRGTGKALFPRVAVLFLAVEAILFFDIFRLFEFDIEETSLIQAELLRLAGTLEPHSATGAGA